MDDDQTNSHSSEHPPLPEIGISEILGLVELLRAKGGREDIYKLAGELQMEFGDTLTVIKAAELLHLVHTPGGDVVLEKLGDQVTQANINEKKAIIKTQLESIPVFKRISETLQENDDHEMTRDQVIEKLAELIPNEDAEQSFSTVLHWGRYAELFGYNDDEHCFYLDDEDDDSSAPDAH